MSILNKALPDSLIKKNGFEQLAYKWPKFPGLVCEKHPGWYQHIAKAKLSPERPDNEVNLFCSYLTCLKPIPSYPKS